MRFDMTIYMMEAHKYHLVHRLDNLIKEKVMTEKPFHHVVRAFIQEQSPIYFRPQVILELKPFTEAEIFTDRMEFFISNLQTIKR